jgi:hypothetical protein
MLGRAKSAKTSPKDHYSMLIFFASARHAYLLGIYLLDVRILASASAKIAHAEESEVQRLGRLAGL